MSAVTLSAPTLTATHAAFLAALPTMESVVRYRLRRLPKRRRAEAVHDALAACWHAWIGLVRRDRDPLEVGAIGIAQNAARYTRAGRQLGCGSQGRGAMDLLDRRAQRRLGIKVVGLDRHDPIEHGEPSNLWRDWLCDDNRVSPADEAAFHVDFEAWLNQLPPKKRQAAALLAAGHGTFEVADLTHLSPGRVSQLRLELEKSWKTFQAEPIALSGL